jgi:DNA-binding NarL/FixJ family response regulator
MSAIAETTPDLGIVDIALQGTNGIELIKNIVAQWPNFPVLVLSMHDESLYAEDALRAGAKGYVMKQEAPEKLTGALRQILNGQIYVSEKLSNRMMSKAIDGKALQDTSTVAILSDRELEVLQLFGRGRGTRQIAEGLNLSVKTIESHRVNIKEKLNLKTAPEMVRFAVQWVSRGAL